LRRPRLSKLHENTSDPRINFNFTRGKSPRGRPSRLGVAGNDAQKSAQTGRNSRAKGPAHGLLYPKNSATRRVRLPPTPRRVAPRKRRRNSPLCCRFFLFSAAFLRQETGEGYQHSSFDDFTRRANEIAGHPANPSLIERAQQQCCDHRNGAGAQRLD
jgi:hypothetical protein